MDATNKYLQIFEIDSLDKMSTCENASKNQRKQCNSNQLQQIRNNNQMRDSFRRKIFVFDRYDLINFCSQIYFISGIYCMATTAVVQTIEREKIVKTFNDTNYFAKGTYKRDFLQLFSTSAIANYITKTVLAPLERWKIIKQTQLAYELRPNKFTSFSHYITKVSQDQGWQSFWRGNAANCWVHFWQVFAQISIFDSIRTTFHQYAFELQNQPISKNLLQRVAAPILASAISLGITHPIDTARVRITMNYFKNPKEMLFTGVTSCWSIIRLQQRSIKGIYRGYLIANLIAVLHLNLYVTFRNVWGKLSNGDNKIMELLVSKESIGSLFAILLLHPLDTIKKNLQLNNQSRPTIFKSVINVVGYYRHERGLVKLYEGLSVSLVRQALFCPIFVLALSMMDKQFNAF